VSVATNHLPLDALLDYWLRDSDPTATETVDEHLFRCDACGRALDELIGLGDGVRAAFRAGAVSAVMSGAFVQRLVAQGMRVREYRLAHYGSVNCTVSPDDELLVGRLEAPLADVQRLDLVAQLALESGVQEQRLEDIPFDPRTGEVLFVPKIAAVKELPANTLRITLLAVEPGGAREVGRYTLCHRPWPGH
jgi:hypothetical protein